MNEQEQAELVTLRIRVELQEAIIQDLNAHIEQLRHRDADRMEFKVPKDWNKERAKKELEDLYDKEEG